MNWRTRDNDAQYPSLVEARTAALALSERSTEEEYKLGELWPGYQGDEAFLRYTERGKERVLGFNNWSFRQLCGLIDAPAEWLARRPAQLIAAEMMVDLKRGYKDKGAQLYYIPDNSNGHVEPGLLRAANGVRYARLPNSRILTDVADLLGDEGWVPAHDLADEAYMDHSTSKAEGRKNLGMAITLSDRDLWMFMVNPNRVITAGSNDLLYPGIVIWNSEVGSASVGFEQFLFRQICTNRAIFKTGGSDSWTGRHVGRIEERWDQEFLPALKTVAKLPTAKIQEVITDAREKEIGKTLDDVTQFLQGEGFGKLEIAAAYQVAEADGLNPRSVYGVVQGLTQQYRELGHNDARVQRERQAARLYRLVGGDDAVRPGA